MHTIKKKVQRENRVRVHLTLNDRRSRCPQGKCQINVFDLLAQVGLFPFFVHRFLKLYLVVTESKTVKESAEQEMRQDSDLCKCLETCEDLSDHKCIIAVSPFWILELR